LLVIHLSPNRRKRGKDATSDLLGDLIFNFHLLNFHPSWVATGPGPARRAKAGRRIRTGPRPAEDRGAASHPITPSRVR
jgi:hypothetical protein